MTTNTFTPSEITRAVEGIFELGLDTQLANVPKVPYQLGVDATQDYRAIVSFIYSLRIDIITLMRVDDTALQDAPKQGSLEANDTGRSDEIELERLETLEEACRVHAAFTRHAQSLAEKARAETEEAGKRTADGSRFRLNRKGRSFTGYLNTFEEWITDSKANTAKDSMWFRKLEAAEEEVGFPLISETDALLIVQDYFEDENAEKISHKAWAKMLGNLAQYGENLASHNAKIEAFNASDRSEARTSQFAIDCKEFRSIRKSAMWWHERHIAPWALLCATGTPKYLVDTPAWRTAAALKRAAEAKVKAAEAQAAATEALATSTEIEANVALFQARNALQIVQAKVAAQMREFEAMTSGKPTKSQSKGNKGNKDVSNLPTFPNNPVAPAARGANKH